MPLRPALAALLLAAAPAAPAADNAPTLNVRELGAAGDGRQDDAPAFRRALAAAASQPGTRILIPAGDYRLLPPAAPAPREPAILTLENLDRATLAGTGNPLLVMGAPQHGLAIANCRELTLRGFQIDYDPLPFTQGVIAAGEPDGRGFSVRIDPGYAEPDGGLFVDAGRMQAVFLDPQTRRWDHRLAEVAYVERAERRPAGRFRLVTSNSYSNELAGSRFALSIRKRAEALRIGDSTNVLCEDLTVHSAPGCAFLSFKNDGIVLRRCTVAPRPGTDRLFSTAADGFHCKLTRRPVLEDCAFSGMADDAINTGSGPDRVCEQLSPTQLVVDPYYFLARPGESVEFLSLDNGAILGEAQVTKVESCRWRGEGKLRVTLAAPVAIPATVASTNAPAARLPGGRDWMRSLHDLPVKPVLAICPETCGRGLVVRGCTFSNYRGRGIMLHAPEARITGNTFDHLYGPGIILGNDFGWGEFGSGRGALIAGNTFRDVRRSNIQLAEAGLPPGERPSGYGIRGVSIEGNLFTGYGEPCWSYGRGQIGNVLSLCDASDVRILGNTFGPAAPNPVAAPTIILDACRQVEFRGNHFLSGENLLLTPRADRQTILAPDGRPQLP